MFVGADDGEAFVVQQALDEAQHVEVFFLVEAMLGAGVLGFQERELGFPEAQHVGLDAQRSRRFADLETALGNHRNCCGLWRG